MEQIKDIIKNVVSCLAKETSNMESLNADEFAKVCDGLSDLAKTNYHCTITEAMEKPENQYGVNYDEHGKYYTPMRKYMHDPDMEMYRDIDVPMGRMYYTDMNHMGNQMMNRSGSYSDGNASTGSRMESRYDRARRGYEESKEMNPNEDNMEGMNEIFETLQKDIDKLKPYMSANEKNIARTKFTNMANMMMM